MKRLEKLLNEMRLAEGETVSWEILGNPRITPEIASFLKRVNLKQFSSENELDRANIGEIYGVLVKNGRIVASNIVATNIDWKNAFEQGIRALRLKVKRIYPERLLSR